jgi:hypothetical protein
VYWLIPTAIVWFGARVLTRAWRDVIALWREHIDVQRAQVERLGEQTARLQQIASHLAHSDPTEHPRRYHQ